MKAKDYFKNAAKHKTQTYGFDLNLLIKTICLYFLLCSCCFISCKSKNSQIQHQEEEVSIPEPPYTISLEMEIDNVKPAVLSEVGSSITYIPLETKSQSLLKDLKRIIATDSNITVCDNDKILMFDSSGRFLRQIGRKGQGPGEYSLVIWDFCFSFDGSKIYLLVDGSRCFEYNVEGKFLNSHKINTQPQAMLPLNDSLFVFFSVNSAKRVGRPINPIIIIADLKNNIKHIYPNYYLENNEQNVTFSVSPFYSYQEQIKFKQFGVDTLYTITENELIPYSFLNLGKKSFSGNLSAITVSAKNQQEFERIIKEQTAGKYYIRQIFEDFEHLYIQLYDLNDSLYGYYNKKSNSIKIIGDQGFQNDIDGGLPFFPKYVYDDHILVDYVNAFTLREHVLNGNAAEMKKLYGKKYDDLVKLVNSIDDESNPIVVMVKK